LAKKSYSQRASLLHPDEIMLEEFVKPGEMSQATAKRSGVGGVPVDMMGRLSYYERWIVACSNVIFDQAELSPKELDDKLAVIHAKFEAEQP